MTLMATTLPNSLSNLQIQGWKRPQMKHKDAQLQWQITHWDEISIGNKRSNQNSSCKSSHFIKKWTQCISKMITITITIILLHETEACSVLWRAIPEGSIVNKWTTYYKPWRVSLLKLLLMKLKYAVWFSHSAHVLGPITLGISVPKFLKQASEE